MRRNRLSTIVSLALSVVMTLSVQPGISFAKSDSPYAVKIPPQFGKVKERYRGTNDKVVIHVQDAHASFDAQENIARLINDLVSHDTVNVVAVEGAQGKLNLDEYRLFPLADVRWHVAENMVASGYLTGSELAGIGMEKEAEFYGVENMRLYDKNLKKFQTVMNTREDIISEIEKIEQILNELKTPLYSKELAQFDDVLTTYQNGTIDFVEITKVLISAALEKNIDIYSFINIALFTESLRESANTDEKTKELIDGERTSLVLSLMRVSKEEKLLTLLRKLEDGQYRISNEKELLLDSFLVKQMRAYRLDPNEYPHFVRNAKFAEKFGQVDKGQLLDEIDQLAADVARALAGTDAVAQEHVALMHNLRLMKNLIQLKVVPSQVAQYRDTADAFSSARYLNFIREQTKKQGISFAVSSKIVVIDKLMEVAEEFYQFAEARSRILVKNTVDRMAETNEKAAVLVAGGYHSDGIVEQLKKKGYSYLVVTPRMDTPELTIPYLERMMGTRNVAEMRFESAFNTLVNRLITGSESSIEKMVRYAWGLAVSAAGENSEAKKLPPHSVQLFGDFRRFVNALNRAAHELNIPNFDLSQVQVARMSNGDMYILFDGRKDIAIRIANNPKGNTRMVTAVSAPTILDTGKSASISDVLTSLDERFEKEIRSEDITTAEQFARSYDGIIYCADGDGDEMDEAAAQTFLQHWYDLTILFQEKKLQETQAEVIVPYAFVEAIGFENFKNMVERTGSYGDNENHHNKLFSKFLGGVNPQFVVIGASAEQKGKIGIGEEQGVVFVDEAAPGSDARTGMGGYAAAAKAYVKENPNTRALVVTMDGQQIGLDNKHTVETLNAEKIAQNTKDNLVDMLKAHAVACELDLPIFDEIVDVYRAVSRTGSKLWQRLKSAFRFYNERTLREKSA